MYYSKLADDAVTTAKLANIAQGSILVGGASDAPTVYDAKTDGQILVGDGTDIASVAVSGDVTLANTGAVTIADDAVTTAKLANIAQGSILVGGASDAPTVYDAKTDGQILVGDGTDIASVAVTGDVTITNAGVTAIGAQKVVNSMLADDAVGLDELVNITDGSILIGGASDAPTEVAVTGDVTITNAGVTAIGAQKVVNSMLADDAVGLDELVNITDGSILIGGASDAPTEVAVTGDVTITNAGVTAIGAQKVVNSMLADDAVGLDELVNITDGSILIGGASDAPTEVAVTGDVTITNAGVTAIGAQKVVNSMLADDAVGLDELVNITDGSILIGGASDAPTEVAVTGDVTITNAGVTAIGAQKVVNSMLADDAVGLDELVNITDGSILIGGASDAPTEVAVTGDVTITNAGVTAIGAQKVVNSMLADDAVGLDELVNITDGSILIGGASDAPTEVAVTGDVTITNAGVTAIGAQKVVNSMLADDAVGLDELVNITDGSILIGGASDAPTEVAVTGDVTITNAGVTAIGAQKVVNSMLADDAVGLDELVNITDGSILIGGASDAPTEVAVTGDVTITNAGVTAIGAQKVVNSMLADDAVGLDELVNITDGSILIGGASDAPTEVAVTGDVTITNAGVTAIGAQKVVNSMLADDAVGLDELVNITDGSILIGGASDAPTEVAVTGDVTITNAGVTAIGAQKVVNSMLADDAVGLDELVNITDGSILIGGASDAPTEVAVTGDVTITNAGVTAIGAQKVVNSMLADDAVGLDELVNITDGSILIGGASDAPTEVAVTGDVTITNAGVTAIGAQKVVNSMLADDAVGLDELVNITDGSILIGGASDAPTEVAVTGDVTITNAGVTAIGAQKVVNSMLADDAVGLDELVNITDGSILIGGASDAPTEVAVTGDVTITNAGVTAIGAQKVVNSMLADDAVGLDELVNITDGSILIGGASDAPTEVAVTGDVTITNAGVTAIGAQKVVNSMLADDAVGLDELVNITDGSILIGGASDAPTEVAVTGDVTITNAGVTAIGAQKVVNSMLADATIDLTSKVTGVLPIAKGGTGGSTASAALNSLGIKSGIHTWSASPSTSQTVTLSGVSSSSIIIVTMNGTGNNQFLKNVVPGSGEFTINMNGDPGDGTKFSYIVIIP